MQRTLESLARQSYLDYEVIVFDDCSTDGTSVAIDELAQKIKFRIIRPERNIGMTAVHRSSLWKYIAIQGAGDVSLPRRLEAQVKFLDNNPDVCLVGCHYRNIVEDISRFRVRTPDAADMSIAQLIENNVFSHGEVMFRKEAYVACGGTGLRFAIRRI
ncbi:glycosyltransferase family 2 protein [Agrobacterium sp. MA01]|uniref:glycosyltransferase family 2 protein n=1 Tax=Agrobacterium sp. MA01 TaxID=2664893 RepID=UPI00189112FA